MKKHILDLSLNELEKQLDLLGLEKFRSKQIWDWIYKKNVLAFNEMSNLSPKIISVLEQNFSLFIPGIEDVSISKLDNSYKFLLSAQDGKFIESILMLTRDRATVCVSCMVGCPLKCSFCATGSEIGFIRKLTAAEILGQILVVQKYAKNNKLTDKLTNIVFMGMGEPFLNIEAIDKTLERLIDKESFGMSKSRITVSTAGAAANIADFINKWGVKLAVSLHFPTDALRSEYMPVNKMFSLEKLVVELKKIKLLRREYITIEYLMLADINDQIIHAKQLINLLSNVKVKFNLIPYNSIKTFDAMPSPESQINKFASYLHEKNFAVTVRRSHGVDVDGGCGQFALKKVV